MAPRKTKPTTAKTPAKPKAPTRAAKPSTAKPSAAKRSATKRSAAKARASTTGTSPDPLGAAAQVDPAAKKAYAELLAEIQDADHDAMRGWDRKYEAAGEVLDKRLFLLSPFGTAAKWCDAVLKEPYRTVTRNVRVARFCSPDDEHRYGTTKLDALLRYLEAQTHGLKTSVKVDLAQLRIPVREGQTTKHILFADASVQQLAVAAKGEQAGTRTRRTPLEAAFAQPMAADADLRAVSVRVSDGRVHFGGIPLTAVARFSKLLAGVDWESALPR